MLIISFKVATLALFFNNFFQPSNSEEHVVFVEKDGIVAVEAEHFYQQSKSEIRNWHVMSEGNKTDLPDSDENHAATASGKKYVECLPDTRTTHDDKLTASENFSNVAGEMAILHYKVKINNPGKYYIWVRAYSTGTEDNGIHVGIDGEWPESGHRLQWCEGKNDWTWDSKQRTKEVHCGVPELIFLEIEKPGIHDIQFSMREDGFEFDKFVLSKAYEKPEGSGPMEVLLK
jgi:hypothetical protein